MIFQDRSEAGRVLAGALAEYAGDPSVLVLALPRGGVPVGYEVARELHAPLDVFVVRKLGAPSQEELALGALASGGARVLNREVVNALGITPEEIVRVTQREQQELERREQQYRGGRPPLEVSGRTVIPVDDGLATGSSMRAAIAALRQRGPAKVVVAVPVAPPSTCRELQSEADQVVCAVTPMPFYAVGQWYRDFTQTSDEEVRRLLDLANQAAEHVA
ncbi:MAG TPA: phosphoribosyltransferase [Terriglobales bacterium]|nr:phosphoribosyltransferase [Terriglobales bacterium]